MKATWDGARLKRLRERYGESQAEFVKRIPNLSIDTLQNWEQDRAVIPAIGEYAFTRLEQDLDEGRVKQLATAS